jgi:hypothetical protein
LLALGLPGGRIRRDIFFSPRPGTAKVASAVKQQIPIRYMAALKPGVDGIRSARLRWEKR